MFGRLILPTGSFSLKPSSCSPRDQLSAIGSTPYHPTMSFPTRNPPRMRIRASFAETLPRVQLSKPTEVNLYQILRIKQTASPIEIKNAYRSLAKQFHPDAAASASASPETTTSESDGRDFMEIHNAYATLSDPTERARYDLSIQNQSQSHGRSRYSSVAGAGGNENRSRSVGFGIQTKRWETDQCW